MRQLRSLLFRKVKSALFLAAVAAAVQAARQLLSRRPAAPVTKDEWADVAAKPPSS